MQGPAVIASMLALPKQWHCSSCTALHKEAIAAIAKLAKLKHQQAADFQNPVTAGVPKWSIKLLCTIKQVFPNWSNWSSHLVKLIAEPLSCWFRSEQV
jgi:hypothetical protein